MCVSGATADVCNGVDDDCDGAIDEDVDVAALQLSDPIVLRAVGEGAVDTCRTCGQVIDADVVLIDGELQVMWNVQFDSFRPVPNMFRRRVGFDGEIRGPAELVEGIVANHVLRAASSGGANASVAFCERRRDDGDSDHYAGAVFGPSGVGAAFRLDAGRGCRAELLHTGRNGERFVFVRLDESGRALLQSVEPSSGVVVENNLGVAGEVGIGGSSGSAVALVVDPRRETLAVVGIDAEGRRTGTLASLHAPVSSWTLPRAAWDGEGWRLFGAGEPGLTTARIAGDGTELEAPHDIDDVFVGPPSAAAFGGGLVALAARTSEGGRAPVSVGSLVIVDRDGAIVRRWRSSELGEGAWLHPSIQGFGGVAALVYSTGSELDHDVRLRLLACAP